ncbi:OLC1v1026777C3 [Oldenlandia corymbosa var. corymbosa]|uniref:Arginyl-tRNA--protein transferase n=2 Tax=Oldenlandia corymbosa var. corymbosa TaxID=529605 RepID=A0AAV1CAM1_OLDCO|nr:OLC1v1026777C3 [Oldenlandia corymbosa var. corymbosa]
MAEKKKMKSKASSSSTNNYAAGENSRGPESVVHDAGRRRSSCGYCGSGGHTSISHGLLAQSLTVDDYQALLDRGWRRSGCYLYKPEMEWTCCPSYTIRLKASEFVPSKEQLRVSKRMQRLLDGTWDVKRSDKSTGERSSSEASCSYSQNEHAISMAEPPLSTNREEEKNKVEQLTQCLSLQIDAVAQELIERGQFPSDLEFPKASVKILSPAKRKLLVEGSEELMFSCNISFQIASALRRAKKDHGLAKFSESIGERNTQDIEMSPHLIAETLAGHLNQVLETSNLLVRACNGHINFYSTVKNDELDGIARSGMGLKERALGIDSKSSPSKKRNGISHGKGSRLEIRMKRSAFDPEEYSLYRKYQLRVHNDTPERVTENSYRRFLVDTPLIFVPPTGDGTVPPCGFGSFHQQYVIDGRLIAVGVIDILPKCLSSKYLFWDPDLSSLSLGKYSALEEIKWVSENQRHCPSLQYYYLGYYIHSCNKMRYKAAYRPSELLCPLRYQWIPFDIAKPLLDRKKYVVLSDFASFTDGEPSILDDPMEEQHDDLFHGGKNDVIIYRDEEMADFDSEESDDESDPEISNSPSSQDGDVGNILIGMKSVRLRFKVHSYVVLHPD